MIKFRLYFDKDKETNWLNEMSGLGYAMTGFFAGFYTFEECTPGKYIYQVDFGNKFFAVDENYREFMNDTGVEIVQPWGYWIILRKLAAEGDFVLYTDVDSSIEHYTKILKMFKIGAIIEWLCFLLETFAALSGITIAIFFSILLGLCAVVFMRMAFKTKRTITELKERKGEYTEPDNNKLSPLVPISVLLNSIGLMLQSSDLTLVRGIIVIIAFVLLIVGIYRSRNAFGK